MRLVGYQPHYFPRLHYLARILQADIFAISDYVQFVRAHRFPMKDGTYKRGKSYQADTPIKTSQGLQHLTVPVQHAGLQPINETKVDYRGRWQESHLRSFRVNYGSAVNFQAFFPLLNDVVMAHYANLAELNVATLLLMLCWLLRGEKTALSDVTLGAVNDMLATSEKFRLQSIVLKSDTDIPPSAGNATDWIIDSCRKLGADEYYCGGTALTAYLDAERFNKAGVKLTVQNWKGSEYTQLFPKVGFLPNLSAVDLLMNETPSRAVDILTRGRPQLRQEAVAHRAGIAGSD